MRRGFLSIPGILVALPLSAVLGQAHPVLAEPAVATPPAPAPSDSAAESSVEATPSERDAEPAEFRLVDGKVVVVQGSKETAVPVPEPVLGLHHAGNELYVARGAHGVSVYDVAEPAAPRLLREFPTPGASATGFVVVEGQVWVTTVSRAARPLSEEAVSSAPGATSAPPAADGGSPSEAPSQRGPLRNIAVHLTNPGSIAIEAGRNDGVRVGDRFAVYRSTEMDRGGADGFQGEELVALAEVVAVKEDLALADLGRDSVVKEGDFARPARAEQKESDGYPERVPHVGEVGGVLRPIINAGSPVGLGVLADATASYWGKAYFADIALQPAGLGWTEDGNVLSSAALLEAGYDGRALAVGLGVGMSWVNGDADYMLKRSFSGADESTGGQSDRTETTRQETHSALTLSQLARLGARDGLSLSLRNLLILHHDQELDESGFIYGGTIGKLSVPLDRRSEVFVEGGGGIMGYWLFGAGVGTWLVGNGSPGSWKLSISAGAAGIWGSREVTETITYPGQQPSVSTYSETIEIAGPMVSAGLLRRFGW